jgi:hypothetical protein
MNEDIFDQDMKEVADELEEKEPQLPEAPVSINVRGYYKGFSVQITKRNAKGVIELEKIIQAVDNMIEKGFKPSWAEETNKKNGVGLDSLPSPKCPKCGAPMVKRTSKTTGNEFWGCSRYPECKGIIDAKR